MFGVVAMETAPDYLSGAAHAVVCLFANGSIFLFDFIDGIPIIRSVLKYIPKCLLKSPCIY